MKPARVKGFTLIEILIVVSLLSITALAITTALMQGIKVFDRFNSVLDEEEKIFFTERFARDTKNASSYSLLPWKILNHSVSFPSIKPEENAEGNLGGIPSLVTYRYDAEKKCIIRTERSFPYGDDNEVVEVLAKDVRALEFSALRDSEDSVPERLTVLVEYGSARSPRELKKSILVPIGYKEVIGR